MAHIYADTNVTVERLQLFAQATYEEQVRTIATLRAAAADESDTTSLSYGGIAAAFLIALAVPASPLLGGRVATVLEWIILVAISVALALIVLAALSPAMILSARDLVRRERALVWLRAFEDELARYHRQRGWAARRWKRAH